MTIVPIYSGSVGINNKIPAHRLFYDRETGVAALETAEDVLIDRTGEIVSRRGTNQLYSGSYHSLFPGMDWGLVAKDRDDDTAIYKVVVSGGGAVSLDGVASGFAKGRKFDFCRVIDAVFYTNGSENGMFTQDCMSVAWKESAWANDESKVQWAAPPPADHLGYNAGRIYFSIGNVLYYTEFGHLGLYDLASDGEQFPSKILVIAPAADGLYVSTQEAIYFLTGLNPKEWTSRQVANYPALEWGKFHGTVDPSFFGFETNVPSSLLTTVNGPVLCLPSGQIVNLIDKNVTLPHCSGAGAIAVFDETLIIQTTA